MQNERMPQEPSKPEPKAGRAWYRRRWFMIGTPIALIGLFAAKGFAHGFGHGHGFHGELSQEDMLERASFMVEMAAKRVDATPEQKKRLQALAAEQAPTMYKLKTEARALRDKLHDAVKRDDRGALEELRKQGVALADRGSQQWLTVYGKLADILSQEQRQKLLERFDRHGRGHHRGEKKHQAQ